MVIIYGAPPTRSLRVRIRSTRASSAFPADALPLLFALLRRQRHSHHRALPLAIFGKSLR